MKRIICLALIVLLILVSCNGRGPKQTKVSEQTPDASEEQGGVRKVSIDCTYDSFDMATDGDSRIYIADKDAIHIYDNNGNKISSIDRDLNFCRIIAAYENRIFALDESEKGCDLKIFNQKGELIEKSHLNACRVLKLECAGDRLFLLQSDEETLNSYLSVYDMESDRLERIDIDHVKAFTKYKDNCILMGVEEASGFRYIIYDYVKSEVIKEIANNTLVADIKYSPSNNTVYYAGYNAAGKLDLNKNEAETMLFAKDAMYTRINLIGDDFVVMDTRNKKLCFTEKANKSLKNQTELVILSWNSMGGVNRASKTIELMEELYPDIKVITKVIDVGDYRGRRTTKLMAGDDDFDIFTTDTYELNVFSRYDCVLDLSPYKEITVAFEKMFNGIRQQCTYDTRLLGVPWSFSADAWGINKELFEKLELELPGEDWTWDDFYLFAKKARKDINGDGIADTYALEDWSIFPGLMRQYLDQYVSIEDGRASFDNEVFKSAISTWKKLIDENLIKEGVNTYKMKPDVVFYMNSMNLDEGDNLLILPPILGKGGKYHTQLEVFCVNANSKNKDACIKFLSTYLSPEIQTMRPQDAFFKDIDLYRNSKFYQDVLSKYVPISNAYNYHLYEKLVTNSAREQFHTDLSKALMEVMNEYLNGRISVDEAAAMIDKKAKMIVGE